MTIKISIIIGLIASIILNVLMKVPVVMPLMLLFAVLNMKGQAVKRLLVLTCGLFLMLAIVYKNFMGLTYFAFAYLFYMKLDEIDDLLGENHYLKRKLLDTSEKDSLSDLYTNQYVYDYLQERLMHINDDPLAVLLMDIDNFRRVNDKFGHKYGDEVIKNIALMLKNIVDESDIVGRYGGEEFIIILNDGHLERALKVGDDIRSNLESLPIKEEIKLTMSIGIAFYNKENADVLLDKANEKLIQAKKLGKGKEH